MSKFQYCKNSENLTVPELNEIANVFRFYRERKFADSRKLPENAQMTNREIRDSVEMFHAEILEKIRALA